MEKLRECPICGSTEIRLGWRNDDRYHITCYTCECTISRHTIARAEKIWNTRYQPKHETVQAWEERTGETYPDDGPVWDRHSKNGEWFLCEYNYMKIKGNKPIVANHNGKPDSVGER